MKNIILVYHSIATYLFQMASDSNTNFKLKLF